MLLDEFLLPHGDYEYGLTYHPGATHGIDRGTLAVCGAEIETRISIEVLTSSIWQLAHPLCGSCRRIEAARSR